MKDKLEINKGMLVENIVAQMLRATGHKLYFFSSNSRTDASNRMEIDFLIPKAVVSTRHNIHPIEVKSTTRYTLTSLSKFREKYAECVAEPIVVHYADLSMNDGILFLPISMVEML